MQPIKTGYEGLLRTFGSFTRFVVLFLTTKFPEVICKGHKGQAGLGVSLCFPLPAGRLASIVVT